VGDGGEADGREERESLMIEQAGRASLVCSSVDAGRPLSGSH